MNIKGFGVSLEDDLLKALDEFALQNIFPDRSQAFRSLIRKNLVKMQWEGNQEVAGAIVLLYDHHHCLETIAVKGEASRLTDLANQLIGLKGIFHGELVMSGV